MDEFKHNKSARSGAGIIRAINRLSRKEKRHSVKDDKRLSKNAHDVSHSEFCSVYTVLVSLRGSCRLGLLLMVAPLQTLLWPFILQG